MRNAFAEVLADLGREDPRVCIVVADISPAGPMAKFREEFPERFINVGVAEQAMIGICAGLALKGMRPFAYTIATFALYRPFDFVRDELAYQNLPGTVVGIGGGVVYSTLGGTHYAQEDVAVASSIPNMSVIAPCDPLETTEATRYAAQRDGGGPIYMRLGKAGEKNISSHASAFEFGRLREFSRGDGRVALISYGLTMHMASEISAELADKGRPISLIGCPTLKPLDLNGLAAVLKSHEVVVVMDEHAPQGGLSAQVQQLAWELRLECRIEVFTLQDSFVHCYGGHIDLLEKHGLSKTKVLESINGHMI